MTEPGPLVDTQAAALAAGVAPSTIRSWAHRGHITPHGQDHRGRTLYHLPEVLNQVNGLSSRQSVDDVQH